MRGIQVDAARFRQIRRARGLTQQELAKRAGVGERTVRNAETGQRVRLDLLRFLSVVLGVELHEVIHDAAELRVAFQEEDRAARVVTALAAMAVDRDLSEYRDLLAEQHCRIIFHTPSYFPFSGEFRGFGGAQRVVAWAEEVLTYEEPPIMPEVRSSGNFVILSGIERLRSLATGRSCTNWWQHIYEFADGRVVRLDMHADTTAIAAAFFP